MAVLRPHPRPSSADNIECSYVVSPVIKKEKTRKKIETVITMPLAWNTVDVFYPRVYIDLGVHLFGCV